MRLLIIGCLVATTACDDGAPAEHPDSTDAAVVADALALDAATDPDTAPASDAAPPADGPPPDAAPPPPPDAAPLPPDAAPPPPPAVRINELVASNQRGLEDADGDSSDWIELYNREPHAVDLTGWYLTDDPEDLRKWRFHGRTLPAGALLVVFASGKDRADLAGELHAGFRLDRDGDYLALVLPDGETIVDAWAPSYPRQVDDVSYGVAQRVESTVLIGPDHLARWRGATDDADADGWFRPDFDDAGWDRGPLPLGYDVGGPVAPGPDAWVELAAGRPAVQSSTLPGYPADLALNGDLADFTHTVSDDADATWTVNLGGASVIAAIALHNRRGCCPSRLRDITVSVLDDAGDPVYTSPLLNPENALGGPARIDIEPDDGVTGRFVRVHRTPDPDFSGGAGNADEATVLSLAEVEVFGGDTPVARAIRTPVEAEVHGRTSALRVRMPFEVAAPPDFDSLRLDVLYDAGFVAWLNGVEVARRNAPEALGPDARATAERPDPLAPETVWLGEHLPLLRAGTNVLAIQALNTAPDDDDLLLGATLTASKVDDGERVYFAQPTPWFYNDTPGFAGFVEPVVPDPPRGFLDAPVDLTLSTATEGAEIRFTLDGTAPGPDVGAVYDGPVAVDRTTIVRAVALLPDHRPSPTLTATYLFTADILAQDDATATAAGLPPDWGGTVADYAMDARVVDPDPGALADALRALPTLSIVSAADGVFGPDGIYTHSRSHGVMWERPASAELIHPDGTAGFQVDCGLRIQGGAFRSHGLTLKHSLRLLFKGVYGATKLRYPLFGEDATDRFDTVTLRSNSNDGWQWSAAGGKPLYVRDSFGRQTRLDMGGVASHETFVHLYINGLYWGVYNPVERPDAAFSAAYHGGHKSEWDALNSGSPVDGDGVAWAELGALARAGLEDDAAYLALQGRGPDGAADPELPAYVDVVDYADYMLNNLYLGNSDWPRKNYWVGRRAGGDGFKFYMWDSEWSLGLRSDLDTDRTGVSIGVAEAWAALRGNAEFRVLVGDRAQRHLFAGGALYVDPEHPEWDPAHPERNAPAARFVALTERVEQALLAESARWGDQHAAEPYGLVHWRAERDALLADYFPHRSARFLDQLRRAGLYPEVAAPVARRIAEAGVELGCAAGRLLYTLDGPDPRLPGGAVAEEAVEAGCGVRVPWPGAAPDATLRVRAQAPDDRWSALVEVPARVP